MTLAKKIAEPQRLDETAPLGPDARMMIYKVLRPEEWSELQAKGESHGAPVDITDGFVHFSTAVQLDATLAKHFEGVTGLVLLACDDEACAPDLRWEASRGGALFPHLYRKLRLSDIVWSRAITLSCGQHITGPLT